jgi:RHS repeat-associated protein
VLEERDGAGTLAVGYVYGDDLISQERSGTASYYHYDGIGSTRALTDDTGTATDDYNYEAFGTLLNKTGATENNYLFTGEQYDPNAGFYYLRARWMNPDVGRFLTVDPFGGVDRDPVTLHKYLYAGMNPVMYVDPSGEFGLVGLMARAAIVSITASLSYSSTAHLLYGSARRPIQWKGTMFIEAGAVGLSSAGLLDVRVNSECIHGTEGIGNYLVMLWGLNFTPPDSPPVSMALSNITLRTPGLLGPEPWLLQGPITYLSATFSPGFGGGYTSLIMGMGMGEMSFIPGVIKGLDMGIDFMGGYAFSPSGYSKQQPCSD